MVARAGRWPETAVRRERRVGNWGRASEHIGAHWEEVGLERLKPFVEGDRPWPVDGYRVVGWVALAADPEMQSTLSRVGLPSPDVVVGLAGGGGTRTLQAVDMKWHLEFASYRQISGSSLQELVEKGVQGLNEQIAAALGPVEGSLAFVDGLLFAPDIPANRAFLASRENKQQEYPIEGSDVIFAPVDGREFFSALPGWGMAQLLARFDRASSTLSTAEGAERYYRLGAGLQGATAQLLTSIFVVEPPPVDPDTAFAWLRSTFRAATTAYLAQEVDKRMAVRSQQLARLRELMRSPYRLSDLAQTLRSHGLAMPQNIDEVSPHTVRCRELLKQVSLLHKQAVRQAGLDLVESGSSDVEALATLGQQTKHFQRLARANADRLVQTIFFSG